MEAALIIGAALLSGLAGVWLGARHREREQLSAHLSEYGAALDALIQELRAIPPVAKTAAMIGDLLERKLPTLDFYAGRLAKATLARATYSEVERLRLATNDLILSAPAPVLSQMERISRHLQVWPERDPDWYEQMRELRDELARLSRAAVARRRLFPAASSVRGMARAVRPQAAAQDERTA
ncbi:MAG: hypothetical protein QOI31_1756 [Solirubrobacterales bacterium]|jgi:hypothetical protein|nr:hypothetical protein [Solirubrobacterales bacterium]